MLNPERAAYNLVMTAADKLTPVLALLPGKTGLFFRERKNQGNCPSFDRRPFLIHAASAGEYEQALPLIKALKKIRPGIPVLLTFFSPSGYRFKKGKTPADAECYLPLDSPGNARRFVEKIRPRAAFFIKYEFWPNIVRALSKRDIPVFSVSTKLTPGQRLFKSALLLQTLKQFTHFFVQDETTEALLKKHGINRTLLTGDTRFDTVADLPEQPVQFPVIVDFKKDNFLIVAGSTWEKDEDLLTEYMQMAPANTKLLLIPHEPTKKHIRQLTEKYGLGHCLYSGYNQSSRDCRVLVVDTLGLLKYAYRYADVAYVGGGFGKGIHNILEAAVYGVPVVFGPNYRKFTEAVEMVERQAAFPVSDLASLQKIFNRLTNKEFREKKQKAIKAFIEQNTGATEKITDFLKNSYLD